MSAELLGWHDGRRRSHAMVENPPNAYEPFRSECGLFWTDRLISESLPRCGRCLRYFTEALR